MKSESNITQFIHYAKSMSLPFMPLSELYCPADIDPRVKAYLQQQGCTITADEQKNTLHFPDGTMEQGCWPLTREPRYAIFLPNGMKLYRRQLWGRANPAEEGLSLLFIPLATR